VTPSPAGAPLDAAEAGLGPAPPPDWLVDDAVAAGGWSTGSPICGRRRPASTRPAGRPVHPGRAWLPGKVRAMADFLRDGLRGARG
jgi:DNA-binding transcriptional LysR family regulator